LKKVLLAGLVVVSAMAADKNPLKTHAEFGFMDTKGNTNTRAYNLELDAKKNIEKHSLEFKFDGQYGESDGVKNKNKFATTLDYNYQFMNTLAFTYFIGYKDDEFSGFDYQIATGPGVKWQAYKSDKQSVALDASILYAYDKFDCSPSCVTKDDDYAAGRAKLTYELQVLENLKFNQDLSYRTDLSDMDNYFVYSKSALSSKISDIFSAGLSYKVDYVNMPPSGKTYTDRTLTANLILDY
jgi:putative salt-induced outer membrane protein